MKVKAIQKIKLALWLFLVALVLATLPLQVAVAQERPGDIVNCGPTLNMSNTPDFSSVDPFILADSAGVVHLFWAERVTGTANDISNSPDAVLYSAWNGESWSAPIDLFLSPPEIFVRQVNAIRGVIDNEGVIHLTWLGPENRFFYSSAHAAHASRATAWRPPVTIAQDQSGAQYSADINFMPPNTLHIVYGRNPEESGNQTVVHIRSTDGGQTWSTPQTIYTVPYVERGASNIRVSVNPPDNVYVTWTEWDASGNGQANYFTRSLDNGQSWEEPVRLAERKGIEYERDWTTVAVTGENDLIAFWEGGFRAYRQAQYSSDGGATWSEPIDTLDWLIADNGFVEFVRDGADRLHSFVFQRVREGNDDRNPYGANSNGLWHSVWEGGTTWREPQLVGDPNSGNFNSVTVRGGNELFAAWFGYIDLELSVIQCQINDTPAIPLQPWLDVPPPPVYVTAQPTAVPATPTAAPTATPVKAGPASFPTTVGPAADPGTAVLVGVIPTLLIIAIVSVAIIGWQRQRQTR
jgi:hypothetical protein